MNIAMQEANNEYACAQRLGLKQVRELKSRGKSPYPAVLDKILKDIPNDGLHEVGLVEIPANQIAGTVSAGRISSFSVDFLPLLSPDSEFGAKWIYLCAQHLSDEGIRDPIECVEYLGNFYIQEGHKRFSVLNYFGAPSVPGIVRRVLPPPSNSPRIIAYYEFLDFYKHTGIYEVQFRQPGQYASLLTFLKKEPQEDWTPQERRTFSSYFQYFREAYFALKGDDLDLLPEEALLLWLQIHPFQDLGKFSPKWLKTSLSQLWSDVVSLADQVPMKVQTQPEAEKKSNLLTRIMAMPPSHLTVAFVHQRDPQHSPWVNGHDKGRQYLQALFGDKVTTHTYCHADTSKQAEELLDQAVEDGANVVFTTSPPLSRATLKAAVKYPKVHFFNCSADAPFASYRSYYCRVFEGKFITGAIAGAMAENNRIGYVGSYPIFGVPASINAFALGAQLTNPRAEIDLRWSCMIGNPVRDFIDAGIHVISNRDLPVPDHKDMEYGEYGTYYVGEDGSLKPLGSPCWLWGRFYEKVVRSLLSGEWELHTAAEPVNYWWGMDSGVIDVMLSHSLPKGVLQMAEILRAGLRAGTIDPFRREILAQDGTCKNDGRKTFTPDELLHMDWLCSNVIGEIPPFEKIAYFSKAMVRQLGIYRDTIPKEMEESF